MTMTIVHATSLRPEELPVFEHALALATAARARLRSVKAHDDADICEETPDAAGLLRRWGKGQLVVDHETIIHSCCEDPLDTLLDALHKLSPSLVLVGTHQKTGAARLFDCSHAEAVVANVDEAVLVFPLDARPFVTPSGDVALRRAVIPCGDRESAEAALERLAWLSDVAKITELEVVLLAARGQRAPQINMPLRDGWTVRIHITDASVPDGVIEASSDACLIVMATRRTNSLSDALFGTNTEHVLRTTRCPVLVVPMR